MVSVGCGLDRIKFILAKHCDHRNVGRLGRLLGYYTPAPWPFHHTPPPTPYNTQDPNEWGFRVPLIVISPWVTKVNYVSSTLRSQGAILDFVENIFNLPSLNGDDSTNDDLADLFAF